MEYEIRCLKREEVDQMKEMSDGENWNFTLEFAQDSYDLNPQHFYCAATPDGHVLSTCGWVPLGGMQQNKVAWFSFFLTRKEHRRKGIGSKVLKFCLESTGALNTGLCASNMAKRKYEEMGFCFIGEPIISYFFPISQESRDKKKCPIPEGLKVKKLEDIALEKLLKYDQEEIHPMPRDASIKLLAKRHHTFYVAVQGERIVGYGCVAKSVMGYIIKPLYANNEQIAQVLLNILLTTIPCEESIELQVPENNVRAQKLFESYGFEKGRLYGVLMFNKEIIKPLDIDKVYSMMDPVKCIV